MARLPRAEYAAFNTFNKNEPPPRECLEGTREEILREIRHWFEDEDQKCIFWLRGAAGTGKSTIARTVCRQLHEEGRLGASFFFSRGHGYQSEPTAIFTTLAVQLAERLQHLRPHIYHAIKENSDIGQQSLSEQMNSLIIEPLQRFTNIPGTRSVLAFVIDALDECTGDEYIRQIIELFSSVRSLGTTTKVRFWSLAGQKFRFHVSSGALVRNSTTSWHFSLLRSRKLRGIFPNS